MLVSKIADFDEKGGIAASRRLKVRRCLSNIRKTACESAASGFDAVARGDYVVPL
jgi:hypothetical protein